MAPDPKDPLQLILKDLGPSPSIESLVGKPSSIKVDEIYIKNLKFSEFKIVQCIICEFLKLDFIGICRCAGGVRDTAPGEDRDDLIAQVGKQEIPLTLNNKFESLAEDDGSDVKPLFVRYVIPSYNHLLSSSGEEGKGSPIAVSVKFKDDLFPETILILISVNFVLTRTMTYFH